MSEQKPLKVVYDVDDVLWGLNNYVAKRLGIDANKNVDFYIHNNPLYTPAEQSAIMNAFHDAEVFKHMDFYPGADEILAAEPYGATVRIHSNCFTDRIVEEKRKQLAKLLPQMKPGFIKLSTITPETNRKSIDQDAYIFVDDCPYNIAPSMAKFNFVPEYPWNLTDKARNTMTAGGKQIVEFDEGSLETLINSRHRYIIYAKNLKQINRMIIEIVKTKQGASYGQK